MYSTPLFAFFSGALSDTSTPSKQRLESDESYNDDASMPTTLRPEADIINIADKGAVSDAEQTPIKRLAKGRNTGTLPKSEQNVWSLAKHLKDQMRENNRFWKSTMKEQMEQVKKIAEEERAAISCLHNTLNEGLKLQQNYVATT
ncbi:uncharacterized protein LOC117114791 [Anneissia japonica]|uniref:uncharacterized protein LOC117114791 n=1 Tax=Anneissia japonica TaxID=1529436 RepID=UPI001425ADDC|nr:uncharacterized protein LOC117114791 [Anneissia japonica]